VGEGHNPYTVMTFRIPCKETVGRTETAEVWEQNDRRTIGSKKEEAGE
jgi:hypothetical protein